MPIRNDPEFDIVLRADFMDIIDEVVEYLLTKMQESMDINVYGAGTPHWYQRNYDNGGLYDSYVKIDASGNVMATGFQVSGKVDQDPMRMVEHKSGDSTDFTHGSEFYPTTDVREFLTDWIINGKSGPLFGDGFWTQKRDFFAPVAQLLTDGTIDALVKQKMISRGMNVM